MKRKTVLLQIGLGVLCVVLIATNVMFWQDITSLSRVVSEHENDITLSQSDCRQMLADLNSSDPARLEKWRVLLNHHLEQGSSPQPRSLDELVALYKSKEPMGRSNYFADLVLNLSVTPSLTKTSLLDYLGPANEDHVTPKGQFFLYRYRLNGREASAFFIVSNNVVVDSGLMGTQEVSSEKPTK